MAEPKSPFSSKTLNFNAAHAILVPALWPLLPESFRQHDWAVPALTAWLTLANMGLRLLTHRPIDMKNDAGDK